MNKIVITVLLLLYAFVYSNAQNSSFIVLGDLHYNIHEDHDLKWLAAMSGDLVKESEDYAGYTKKYWVPFMQIIRQKALSVKPPVSAVIQVGDLSEGLAGSAEKARQMMSNTVKAIDSTRMPVPWIIAKGNHETYGPGADDAYREYFVPMFQNQTGNKKISSANYSYTTGNVQITCLDPWDKNVDIIAFLEKEFSSSKAKYKFVVIHKPVIPVSTYCWYTFKEDEQKRQKLLEIIAKNRAVVIAGHIHRYSVVSRKTAFGNVVQLTAISVVKDSSYLHPGYSFDKYSSSITDDLPDWSKETLNARKEILNNEAEFVTYFKQTDLPGYAVIKIDDENENIMLEYFAAFGKNPYDVVNLTGLMNR